MREPKDVLLVGLGKMGVLHGGLMEGLDLGRVKGIVDKGFLPRWSATYFASHAETFGDLSEALRDLPELEVAFICTPPTSHFPIAKSALEAGLDVFVEKPLTTQVDHSSELCSIASSENQKGVVGYVRRFHPTYCDLKERMKDQGRPEKLEVRLLSGQMTNASEEARKQRGGVVLDLLPHVLDMLLWLADVDSQEVTINEVGTYDLDRIALSARAKGIPIEVEADWATPEARKPSLTARADYGSFELESTEDMVRKHTGKKSEEIVFHKRDAPPPKFNISGVEFSQQTEGIFSFLDGRSRRAASLEDGRRVDSLIDRIAEAE